ncbi:MAG: dihydrodipicolinate synthase family protein [Clostridia bacterium]|nr:dihydrodipicolinate synthase family protein [Clostridia bacterium]
MQEQIFRGIYGIVLTPFRDDGSVDFQALQKQIDEAAKSKSLAGFVVCGSTGEFTRLTFGENVTLMRAIAEANGKRKQLICGATAGDSQTATRYIEEITNIGADGILLAPPYYFKLKDSEILAYYQEAFSSNEKKIPVVGYNIPQCTNPISLDVFEKLLEYDEVKGFKNSWFDLQEITAHLGMIQRQRPDISYFTGLDGCLRGVTALGGDGIFSALSYLMPDVMEKIFADVSSKDSESCQFDILDLVRRINRFSFPYGYRMFSEIAGKPLGEGREAIPEEECALAAQSALEMKTLYQKLLQYMEE